MVALRAVGLLALALGLAATYFCAYGIVEARDFAHNLAQWQRTQGIVIEPSHFRLHWTIYVVVAGAAGIALLAGGVALLLKRRWGLLSISAATIIVAAHPLILRAMGANAYGFESAEAIETAALIGIAVATAAVYFWSRTRVAA